MRKLLWKSYYLMRDTYGLISGLFFIGVAFIDCFVMNLEIYNPGVIDLEKQAQDLKQRKMRCS